MGALAAAQGVTILVVEDNRITRRMMRAALEPEGFRVLEAEDGAAALAAIALQRPELVFQDLRLPDINGFDLLARLRALDGMAEVPVICVSGALTQAHVQRALDAGFTDCLLKPAAPSAIVRAARALLSGPAATPPAEMAHGDAGRNAVLHGLLSAFVERLGATHGGDGNLAAGVEELLVQSVDAFGYPSGAIFLRDALGRLELRAAHGVTAAERPLWQTFFGRVQALEAATATLQITRVDPTGADSPGPRDPMLIVPLPVGTPPLGVLVLAGRPADSSVELVQLAAGPIGLAVAMVNATTPAVEDSQRTPGQSGPVTP